MYITIDDEDIVPNDFVVCEFYGVKTCFCWNTNKLIVFPYTNESVARDVQVLSTPAPIKKIQCFDGRIFLICLPQGVYKLSRANEFAVLSKNALGIGTEFCEVLIYKKNAVYLDNKQAKSSKLLFPCSILSRQICTFPLIVENVEEQLVKCFTNDEETKSNLCIIGYDKKLFLLTKQSIQLIYTSDSTILDITPIKRGNKIAGLLLLTNMDMVILMNVRERKFIYEKIHLEVSIKDISTLCAVFNLQAKDILWIVYCSRQKLYYARKKLFTDTVPLTRMEDRSFTCIQHYDLSVILGLSKNMELLEFSLETIESTLSANNNIKLDSTMFQKTDPIVEKVCRKVKELDILHKVLGENQDKLRRINLYASKQKFQINPYIEIHKLQYSRYHNLTLIIPEKLPKNNYVIFTIVSKKQNTFCMKKTTESEFTVEIPFYKEKISYYSKINMDLVTLMRKEAPWCLTRNFIHCLPQDNKRKGRVKKDKTAFINAKIALLQNLIIEKSLNMTKLCEIKGIIRTEL